MFLGELIETLSKHDQSREVANGFGDPHSWRGDYAQVAFTPSGKTTIGAMLKAAKSALGATYPGWKGGDYTMDEWSECYLAQPGDCGESVGPTLLRYMIAEEALDGPERPCTDSRCDAQTHPDDGVRRAEATGGADMGADTREAREDAREAHSGDERAGKYRAALQSDYCGCGACEMQLAAVMAVADAERVEKCCEVEDDLKAELRAAERALAVAGVERVEKCTAELRAALMLEQERALLADREAEAAERALAVERARMARLPEAVHLMRRIWGDEVADAMDEALRQALAEPATTEGA